MRASGFLFRRQFRAFFGVFHDPAEIGDGIAEAVAFGPLLVGARLLALLDEGEHFGGNCGDVALEGQHVIRCALQSASTWADWAGVSSPSSRAEFALADEVEQVAERPGDVQVFIQRSEELLAMRGEGSRLRWRS